MTPCAPGGGVLATAFLNADAETDEVYASRSEANKRAEVIPAK